MRIDGLIIMDKPEGITSLDVVREVKRRCHVRKAGHIGTLDPFATGVLPIVINEGTKLVPFIEEGPKEYEAVLKVGEETETDDLTGKVVSRKPCGEIPPGQIQSIFDSFLGRIEQVPPMFSAVKMQGIPLYRLARKGIEIERKERGVEIFDIRIEEIALPQIRFRISCSKGTYIRTLARDIGRKMGFGAHLLRLRRLRSGPFHLEQAISWESLKEISGPDSYAPWLISMKEALRHLPEVVGDEELVRQVRFGKGMAVRDIPAHGLPDFEKGQWLKMSSPEEGLVAILKSEVRGSDIFCVPPERVVLRPLRVFHPNRV